MNYTEKEILKERNRLRELIKDLDVKLYAWDPGVSLLYKGKTLEFEPIEWEWIETLLEKLKTLEKKLITIKTSVKN